VKVAARLEDRGIEVLGGADREEDEATSGDDRLSLLEQRGPAGVGVVDPNLELEHAVDRHLVVTGDERFERKLHALGVGSGGQRRGSEYSEGQSPRPTHRESSSGHGVKGVKPPRMR